MRSDQEFLDLAALLEQFGKPHGLLTTTGPGFAIRALVLHGHDALGLVAVGLGLDAFAALEVVGVRPSCSRRWLISAIADSRSLTSSSSACLSRASACALSSAYVAMQIP